MHLKQRIRTRVFEQKKKRRPPEIVFIGATASFAAMQLCIYCNHLFVASSPDVHLLGFLNQPIAEIRVRNRNQSLRSLPCG